jgi:hypothetical protein
MNEMDLDANRKEIISISEAQEAVGGGKVLFERRNRGIAVVRLFITVSS